MPAPSKLHLHKRSNELELHFPDAGEFRLSAEYLRVYSPSAEVRGHSSDQAVLQTGKKYAAIEAINPVGNYAVQLVFSDGHDTGLYAWDYLYELCTQYDDRWDDYLARLEAAGESREPRDAIFFKA